MNYYLIVKFIHILGALGYFVALGLDWTSLHHLQRATTVEHPFLMTLTPGLLGSLPTIGVAIVPGLVRPEAGTSAARVE